MPDPIPTPSPTGSTRSCRRLCCGQPRRGDTDYCSDTCRLVDASTSKVNLVGHSFVLTSKASVAEARAGGLHWLDVRAAS